MFPSERISVVFAIGLPLSSCTEPLENSNTKRNAIEKIFKVRDKHLQTEILANRLRWQRTAPHHKAHAVVHLVGEHHEAAGVAIEHNGIE